MTAGTGERHTKGPWTNDKYSTFVWSKHGNVCACGDPRAETVVGYTECKIGSPELDEAVANARLIAAAPAMLAQLKAVLGSRVFSIDFEENRTQGTERWHLRKAMIEVIAKATAAHPMTADIVRLPGSAKLLENDALPNIRIRKRLMLDALQKASIAIHRGEWERADAYLIIVRGSIANTRKK